MRPASLQHDPGANPRNWRFQVSYRIVRNCEQCGAEFITSRDQLRRFAGGGRFCSLVCKGLGQTRDSADPARVAARFWELVDKNGPVHADLGTSCWIWRGDHNRKGYARFNFGGKRYIAHRYAFFLQHSRWPEPCALHKCDGGAIGCVRWDHLFEGTMSENSNDRHRKGRTAHGENAGQAKLTEAEVIAIHAALAAGETVPQLAKRLGQNVYTLYDIRKGRTWMHLHPSRKTG